MTTIAVFGGNGYMGGNIIKVASEKGFKVISISRSEPKTRLNGVDYVVGNLIDTAESVVKKADVIVAALSPRAGSEGKIQEYYLKLAKLAKAHGRRLIIGGGFSSLRPERGAPRFGESPLPPELQAFQNEVEELMKVATWFRDYKDKDSNWIFVSPAAKFNSYNPGSATGKYRVGDEIALKDKNGGFETDISGADFALAIVEEIKAPKLSGHINLAY